MDYRIVKKETFSVVAKVDFLSGNISIIGDDKAAIPDVPAWDRYLLEEARKKVSPDLEECSEIPQEIHVYLFKKEEETPDGFEEWQVPASTWAVFKCVGETPDAARDETYKRFYSEWLPQAKYELDLPNDIHFHYKGTTDSPGDAEMWVAVKEK